MTGLDELIDPYKEVKSDPINPDYYRRFGGVEVNDITKHLSFNLGNVVKYSARAGFKAGTDAVQDLSKAKWYLESEIDRLS